MPYGPLWPIDGPQPVKPPYGLLQAADVPNSGVRFVVDAPRGVERWGNGVVMYPSLIESGNATDPAVQGSPPLEKGFGGEQPQQPEVFPFLVWIAESCTAVSVLDQAAYRARAVSVFGAIEGANVERELLSGDEVPANPHLSDGTGTFPNGDVPTSVLNGLALLEGEIARSRRSGVIHVSPMVSTFLHNNGVISDQGGALKTVNGITVIPGFGYVDSAEPSGGHLAASGWQEWIYATGPIEIRRSETIVIPDTVAEATDRGLGATYDQPNTITYIVERYYLVTYDEAVKAAVLVDRCDNDCGTAPS